SGLLPHRSYCFAVEAVDNAGNASSIAGKQAEREFFFVNAVAVDDMNPSSPVLDGGQTYITYGGAATITDVLVLDFDGDNNSDFILQSLGGLEVYLSTLRDSGGSYPISIAAAANGSGFFAYGAGVGDFDNDGFDDFAVGDSFASDGASGGAVYVYYGRDDSASGSPWWGVGAADADHPSVTADVIILGAAASWTGLNISFVDVNDTAGDELVFTSPFTANRAVFGISGGDRSIFTQTKLELVSAGAGAGEIAPSFTITGYAGDASGMLTFGENISAADLDGDGVNELVFADSTIQHAPGDFPNAFGEVYVFNASGLTDSQSLVSPTSLVTTIRRPINGGFGSRIAVLTQPRAGDSADWLAINTSSNTSVALFKGTSTPTLDPAVTAGLIPLAYDVSGLAEMTYDVLDSNQWDGSSGGSYFGTELAFVNLGSHFLVAAPGLEGSSPLFFYSYDSGTDTMVKKAVIPGTAAGYALKIKASTTDGIGNLLILNKSDYNSTAIK
ncbi:MAG: hypothetical protein HOK28_12625, partial [Deltaproteobacteria bacterium]|nr:hypothetical protein [Deltaproteobacteria bacterium]